MNPHHHLPIQANWKKTSNYYDGKETRNWASYNPQTTGRDPTKPPTLT